MIVYWKQTKYPKIKIGEDDYKNPLYELEENFGEVIGAMDGGNGSQDQRLIIATPNGKISNMSIDSCYHKSAILRNEESFQQSNARVYGSNGIITNKDDVYTIEEWEDSINNCDITIDDGYGYWVKDGYKSNDEVFSTEPRGATHVIWFNK